MSRVPGGLWKRYIALQIYGANTNVGKTVFSTLLGLRFSQGLNQQKYEVQYIKPVSTGPASDRDDEYVERYTGQPVSTLYQFPDAVSPHIAARGFKDVPNDNYLNFLLHKRLRDSAFDVGRRFNRWGIGIVETAGGVLSPGPSGTPQADIYRQMRLPTVLVGDHKLGGISATISAAESLILRGYDINALICFEDRSKYLNSEYLNTYFEKLGIPVFVIPWIPRGMDDMDETEEREAMKDYYDSVSKNPEIFRAAEYIIYRHKTRMENLNSMASRTHKTIWHPFTQHKDVQHPDDILVFDSAHGDYFQVKTTERTKRNPKVYESSVPMLYPAFDGSASWWTQGLGHGNPRMALETAYAAGRYGHVMFAGATHEPALELAERVLDGLENPRLKKIFYTDNGSTATEVGIKMGIRTACKHYGWDGSKEDIGVLGLKGSYHGDTIGAMDASEPCVFNEKVDWYRGRGYWFDYPTFKLKDGRWVVESPKGMEEELGHEQHFEEQEDIFDLRARGRSRKYEVYIEKVLDRLVKDEGKKFGVLVMEPVILGAGGMVFVDPLFQRSLVRVVRGYNFSDSFDTAFSATEDEYAWTGLPVMFDEVFTGLYRLGRFSSASYLSVNPDISVHAKLLTGGLLPLSITAASQSIYDAFWGDEKSEALLHGHSYTAHPIGCHVANVSLRRMATYDAGDMWNKFKDDWQDSRPGAIVSRKDSFRDGKKEPHNKPWSFWTKEFIVELSEHENVEHVNALGCVLAVSLKDRSGAGYTSSAAVALRDKLLYGRNKVQIHSRVLGNVLYLMSSLTSIRSHLRDVESTLLQHLKSAE